MVDVLHTPILALRARSPAFWRPGWPINVRDFGEFSKSLQNIANLQGNMKDFVLKYWWIPPILLLFLLLLGIPVMYLDVPDFVELLHGNLVMVAILLLPTSQILLLVYHKWWKTIVSFVVSVLILGLLIPPLILAALSAPDHFGDHHPIPDGQEYSIPLEEKEALPAADSLNPETWLVLRNDFQGGQYSYYFSHPALPAGEVYLKAFEVTENIPLENNQIYQSSCVKIDSTQHFTQLVDGRHFTIYYGDWGDYYAARIEVWHRDAATGEDRKLLEKIYRVDGWQR